MDYDEFEDEYVEEVLPNGRVVRHRATTHKLSRQMTMNEMVEWVSSLDYRLNQAMAMAMGAVRMPREPDDPLKITLPVADTLKDVARESVRQSIRKMASKDLITEQAERAIQQSIVQIIEKSLGKNSGSFDRDSEMLRQLRDHVAEPLNKLLDDKGVVSMIVDKALKQIEYLFDPSSSWTQSVVEKTIKALEEEVHEGIRKGVREKAKALTERVLSEVIDSALREEMPALDQLQALLLLGIGDRS